MNTRKQMCNAFVMFLTISCSIGLKAEDFSALYAATSESVVTIHTATADVAGEQITQSGLGSGVLVEAGLVMTAAHVVQGADRILVKFKDGYTTPAQILSSVRSSDVALIKLKNPPANPTIASIGNSSEVLIGEPVYVIGAPYGIDHTLSVGNLSGRLNRGLMAGGQAIEFLQTDTTINTGNSGGPMFNNRGEVIGIVSFILTQSGDFDGIGFAVSINGARQALMQGTAFWTGFEGIFLEPHIAAALNVPQKTGVLVQHVVSDSIADVAGLRGGRIPVQIDGIEVRIGGDIVLSIQGIVCESPHNFTEIKEQIAALSPGDSFTIKVIRKGKIVELLAIADDV